MNLLPTIIAGFAGILTGIHATFKKGAYYEGEKTIDGKQVLTTSILIDADSNIPISADNSARGLYKVQLYFKSIGYGAFLSAGFFQAFKPIRNLSFSKQTLALTLISATISYIYGTYVGKKTEGIPYQAQTPD